MVKVPFLVKVPIDPEVGRLADKAQSVLVTLPNSQVAQVFRKLVEELTKSKEAWNYIIVRYKINKNHILYNTKPNILHNTITKCVCVSI